MTNRMVLYSRINPIGAAEAVISALTPAAWYHMRLGAPELNGSNVSNWQDRSGNGRDLLQATATNQPAYSAGVITFDGVDNYLKTNAFTLNQPTSLYLVGQMVSWSINDELFDGGSANTGAIYQAAASPQLALFISASAASNSNMAVGTNAILCVVFNGASSSIRVNNTTKTTGNPGTANMGGLTLGANGAAFFSNMKAMEFVAFSAAHDDATQSSVISALNTLNTVF